MSCDELEEVIEISKIVQGFNDVVIHSGKLG